MYMSSNKELMKLNFSKAKILVVGDVMLDQYWLGGTSRISPEAPVPVVKINKTDNRLGGAANVAYNLLALGCDIKLLGAIGDDNAAEILLDVLDNKNIPHDLQEIEDFATIVKLRVLSKQQQMIRLDHEKSLDELSPEQLRGIYDSFAHEIENYSTVVLSDYAKGVLIKPQPFIKAADSYGARVIIDPKTEDFSVYKGAYVVKPNLAEFEAIVGKCSSLDILEERARNLIAQTGIKNLIITRGGEGMTVVQGEGESCNLPAYSSEVFDVTGAGDTVIAVLAASISSNLDLLKAAHISTIAASIAVSKVGTSCVNLTEIKHALTKPKELETGALDLSLVRDLIKQSQARGEKVVFINGCYDLLHHGHIKYLERARALGDRLVIGINSDESVRRLKGPARPMYNIEQRMQVLAALRAVDWVVPFTEDTPGKLVEFLNPDVLAKGDEHFKSIDEIPSGEGVEHVVANGGSAHLIARTPECSSTQMLEVLSEER